MPAKMLMERMSQLYVGTVRNKREIGKMLLNGSHAQKPHNHVVMVSTQERTDNCSLITHMMLAKTLREKTWYHNALVVNLKREIQILANGLLV
jgi:hypothetical protein